MHRNIPESKDRFIASRTNTNIDIANWRLTSEDNAVTAPRTAVESMAQFVESTPIKNGNFRLAPYRQALSQTLFNQSLSTGPDNKVREARTIYEPRKLLANSPVVRKRKTIDHTKLEYYHILDAPDAIDDFYCNYLDWGKNVLSIALAQDVYLWHPETRSHVQLKAPVYGENVCDRLALHQTYYSNQLIAGTSNGKLEIYDMSTNKHVFTYDMPKCEIIAIQSYEPNVLVGGTRCGRLFMIDDRLPAGAANISHKPTAQVCGLTTNGLFLAAGYGNDIVEVWDPRSFRRSLSVFNGHKASIKAMQFSPSSRNRIATASGKTDHTVCFWNIETGQEFQRFTPETTSTSSHITSLNWTGDSEDELVITIGNEIQLWCNDPYVSNYTMKQNVDSSDVNDNTSRIISASKNPVTGSIATLHFLQEVEQIRLWKLLKPAQNNKRNAVTSAITSSMTIR